MYEGVFFIFFAASYEGLKYSPCKQKIRTASVRSREPPCSLFFSLIRVDSWFTGSGLTYLHLYWCVWEAGREATDSILIRKKMDFTHSLEQRLEFIRFFNHFLLYSECEISKSSTRTSTEQSPTPNAGLTERTMALCYDTHRDISNWYLLIKI